MVERRDVDALRVEVDSGEAVDLKIEEAGRAHGAPQAARERVSSDAEGGSR